MPRRSFTSQLYRADRLSADARAVRRGRVGRRLINKGEGKLLGKAGFWRALWGSGRRR
jgi:hypothetical protein